MKLLLLVLMLVLVLGAGAVGAAGNTACLGSLDGSPGAVHHTPQSRIAHGGAQTIGSRVQGEAEAEAEAEAETKGAG